MHSSAPLKKTFQKRLFHACGGNTGLVFTRSLHLRLRRLSLICAPVLLVFALMACERNDESAPAAQTPTEQLPQNALALSDSVFSRITVEYDNDFSGVRQQLYEQAEGDSLHPSSMLAQIINALLEQRAQRYDVALDIAGRVYQQADSLGYDAVKLRAIPTISFVRRFNGDMEEAMAVLEEGLELASRMEEESYELALKEGKGLTLTEMAQYNAALNLYYEVAEAYEEEENPYRLSGVYGSIALLFSEIQNYEESEKWHRRALALQQQVDDKNGMGRTYNNLAIVYSELGELEKAIETYQKSIALSEELSETVDIIRSTYNIGNSYQKLEEHEQAVVYYSRSLQLSEEYNVPPGLMYSKMGLGRAYWKLGELEQAVTYLTEAQVLGRQMNSKAILKNTNEALYEIAKQRGEFEQALAFLEQFKELSDEFNELARNRALDELIIEHNVETTRAENEFLEETLALQQQASRNKTASIIFLGTIVLILIGFTYYFFRTRKKLQTAYLRLNHEKETVARKNKELEQVSKERQAFLHIIVHDLRNPLSAISGTLELIQMYRQKEIQDLIDIMDQSARRMHLLIDSLLQIFERENMQLEKKNAVIADIVQQTVEEHQPQAQRKNIAIHSSLPDFEAETHAESIQNIVSNLLSNAIKYTPASKNVYLGLRRDKDSWEFYIRDEGPGFTTDDKKHLFKLFSRLSAKPTAGEISTGVGLYSVKMLVKRLGGTIELEKDLVQGAGFVCRFPIRYEPLYPSAKRPSNNKNADKTLLEEKH